jgi:hypothetical protein
MGNSLYYVVYIKNCELKIDKFKTDKLRKEFLKDFKESDDDWIYFTFDGKLKKEYQKTHA